MYKIVLSYFANQYEFMPPIGLLSISSYVRHNLSSNVDIKIIKVSNRNDFKKIIDSRPSLVGFSSPTATYSIAIQLARIIKQNLKIPLVIGGAHITLLPESMDKNFDVGVIGEGENTFLELVKIFLKNGHLSKEKLCFIDGIAYHGTNGISITKSRDFIKNLDDLPHIDWDLLERHYFRTARVGPIGDFKRRGVIFASRGCPNACIFCSSRHLWNSAGVRFYSMLYVADEIERLIKGKRIEHIMIMDDNFSINRQRIPELIDILEKRDILKKISFTCKLSADTIDEEMCKLLTRLNVKSIYIGFESGSERILKFLKQEKVIIADNYRAVALCKKYNINVVGSIIFGTPGEDRSDLDEMLRFIEYCAENGVIRIASNLLMPYPGTPLWDMVQKEGLFRECRDIKWEVFSYLNLKNPVWINKNMTYYDL